MKTRDLGLKLLPLVAAFVTISAFAEGTNRYEGSTWALLDSKKTMETAAGITLTNYPDCDEATVDKNMVRVYRADGTGETQDETFTKVLTEKGKRANRTLSLNFMLPYFTVDVPKLEVLRPNGEVIPVDVVANSKETIDDSQMSMNIYDPNSRVLRVNIPKLEVGDVVHSVTRMTIERPIMPGEYAEGNVLEGRGYIHHTTYEIHAPAQRPLKQVFLRDEIPGTVKYTKTASEEDTTVHRWEVSNVPAMFDEPAMPPYENVLQRLLVTTTPDWQSISKWYWELSKPHLDAASPELKQSVADLTANAKTDLDKTKALFYYVSKKVRYMGITPEKDRPGFEPHDVGLTFGKKYGVCRDKAALLVSMLRAAGLSAYPVLINVGTKMDNESPDPFFNHAIVSVELTPGHYELMDPTDENTKELLPAQDRNQSFLVCRPEGEMLMTSPINPPEENMMEVKTVATLSAAGFLETKSEVSFAGVNDNAYRDAFAHMKPDDQWRFFERNLKRSMPGARLKSLKLTPEDMLDVSQTVHAQLEFTVDGLTATGNGKAVVSMPWIGKSLGIVNFILDGTGLDKRKYPMQTFVTCGLHEDVSIKLADGFTGAVSMPTCSPVNDACLGYHQHFDYKNGSLAGTRELKLKVVEFSPEEYLKLKHTLAALEYDERKTPVLSLSENAVSQSIAAADPAVEMPVESNARVLESHKELEVKDAHTATLKAHYVKRILSYAGKIREAEVKIDYNPSCQEAKIVRAVVTSKTGERQEISKDEINVMDAGWNASAKRYTGGKILVANLPGVDIGSTVEVEFEITTKGAPFVSGFEYFQLPDQLDNKSFALTAPAGLKIEKRVTGPTGGVTEKSANAEGKEQLQWQAQNVKALPAEQQLPPGWIYAAGVGYFIGDEGAYLKDLNQAFLAHSAKCVKAEETARQITRDAKTRLEALQAIRDYIAKSIRMAGPSFTDLPLSELSDADTTLQDGYGHSADRAILYHAMLSAAGFQPEFVLASDLPPIAAITNVTASFPLPLNFERPLVRVVVDGETYYLNDTDQYARLGSTSHDGHLGIALATQTREVLHAAKNCRDKMETDYILSVADNGKTRVGITRHYYGTEYGRKNRFFSELPPEERRRYFQEVVSDVTQGARPVGDLKTQFDVYPGVEQFTVEVDNYSVVDGKFLYFDLPFTPSLFPVSAGQRALPLYVSEETERTIRTEIELPSGFKQVVIAPKSDTFDAPGGCGKAEMTSEVQAGRYVITHRLTTSPAIVDPKDYSAMLKLESALGRKSSKVFLLQGN